MTDVHPTVADSGVESRQHGWWRQWRSVIALTAWSLFVWVGRVRNVIADDVLDAEGRNLRLALALSFVVPAAILGVGAVVVRLQQRAAPQTVLGLAVALASWTVVVWVVRGSDIAFDGGYDVGFRLVHSALALASIVLAGWTLKELLPLRRRVTIS